ncbi:MAG: GNAT family N-acetyltransferase [Candidatus Fermentibacteraceae bacterium]|nr:GNAT family N-acetyltransferase [Candidatus Fermentibacteraceae bacterium]
MDPVVFRDLRDSDIDGVVRMWKESLSGWPPGFFGGSEMSADTVRREEKSSGKLFTVLALEGDRVVGYCMTSPYGGEPEASYVNLINVVPDMHGRGIGKALLLDAVKRSAQLGLYRIDLHTWPANMKAVPLYKKAGFFWVPDTNVYMQNYMPYLLGRSEFREFLHGDDWYECFRRELLVEQDIQRTDSGREVFTYWFRKDDREFLAEFDRSGRVLSRMEYPGFRARLEVDSGREYFVGRRYNVRLTGFGFDSGSIGVSCGESMECASDGSGTHTVEPRPVRLGRGPYEPADRMIVRLPEPGPELGLGICGVEEVALESPPLCYLAPGTGEIRLDLKKLSDVPSICLSWSLDGVSGVRDLELSPAVFQSCTLPLPDLEEGIHSLALRFGESAYQETVLLVIGSFTAGPAVIDTRRAAVMLGESVAITVSRKGGKSIIWRPGRDGRPRRLGSFFIGAGPPLVWNSDLPKQTYQLELGEGEVSGWTDWPSRPGMVHRIRVRLDRTGFIESSASVENGSEVTRAVHFRARSSWSEELDPQTDILPMPEGIVAEQRVYNQLPDWSEDLSSSTSGLAAPWLGVTGGDVSMMNYFPVWTELEYDLPGTEEEDVKPGALLESPSLRVLVAEGGMENLFAKALRLGWQLGDTGKRVPFFLHDLEPVMASGVQVSLTHPLHGEREGRIIKDGTDIAAGPVRHGRSISGKLQGKGRAYVGLSLAKRDLLIPVFLVDPSEKVELNRGTSGELTLENHRIKAVMDPGSCGHVHSLKLDGVEYLTSAHPEPSEFCWEKPWFGGICPRISGSSQHPYQLEKENPSVEEFQHATGGLVEMGWRLSWRIDHKDFGSLGLTWEVSLVPGVPVLRTVLGSDASEGGYHRGELDFRGFLKPGGSIEDSVLTCQRFPNLAQRRDHAGSWTGMGDWARVSRGESFVEAYSLKDGVFFCEDYGKQGCHLSVFSTHDRKKTLEMLWLFGSGSGDDSLAHTFRRHR